MFIENEQSHLFCPHAVAAKAAALRTARHLGYFAKAKTWDWRRALRLRPVAGTRATRRVQNIRKRVSLASFSFWFVTVAGDILALN